MFCRYCGAKVSDDALFCSKCGKQLRRSEPAGQPVRAPEQQDGAASAPHTHPSAPEQTPVGERVGRGFGQLFDKARRLPKPARLVTVAVLILAVGMGVGAVRFSRPSNPASHTSPSGPSRPVAAAKPTATPKPASGSGKYHRDSGVIPDVNAFSGYAFDEGQLATEVYRDSTKISYAFDKNAKFQDEYLALLETYGFKLREKHETNYPLYYRHDYVYDYVGKAAGGGSFDADTSEVDNKGVAIFIYCYDSSLTIRYADGFTYTDTGERTTQKLRPQYAIGSPGSSGGGSSGGDTYSPNVAGFAKQDCTVCDGSGKCQSCGGSGYVWSSASKKYDRDCPNCRRSGRCPSCGGSGKR